MSDWVGDTSEYRPWKELVYQSDPDDPDFVPPESESDVVDSRIESGDEGDGDDHSAGGDESDSESEKDGGGDNNDRDRENDGEGDRDEIRRKRPRQEDEEGEEGQREKKSRRKEKKDLREEDIMERFEFEIEEAVANWFDEFQIRRGVIPESDNEDEDPVVTRDRKIRLVSDDKLAIGRTFFTGFEFKEFMLHYAMKNRLNIKQNRWEKDKISFRCAQKKGCDWKVYCSYNRTRQLWVLVTKCLDHSCTPNGKCRLLKSRVIARLFMVKPGLMAGSIGGVLIKMNPKVEDVLLRKLLVVGGFLRAKKYGDSLEFATVS